MPEPKLHNRRKATPEELDKLLEAAIAIQDFYGPIVDEPHLAPEERRMFNFLSRALVPFTRKDRPPKVVSISGQ